MLYLLSEGRRVGFDVLEIHVCRLHNINSLFVPRKGVILLLQCSLKLFSLPLIVESDFLQPSTFNNFAKKVVGEIRWELVWKLSCFLTQFWLALQLWLSEA